MLSIMLTRLKGATALSLLLTGVAFAQEQDTPAQETVPVEGGGQVVVEQADPQVSVTIEDPEVFVDRKTPEVTVEQPQPEITVQVQKPTVTVQQQAPVITIEQAQPTVTVRIPEPIITVRVPRPEVTVDTAEPQVEVEQAQPTVRFVRPEPNVIIEESEPEIRIEQSEPQVEVGQQPEANVQVEQAEANVTIEETGEAEVEVMEAEPQVEVVEGGEADVQVEQQQARVEILDYQTDETGRFATEEERENYRSGMSQHSMAAVNTQDLIGRRVISSGGEDVGEIDQVGLRGDTVVVILGIGGFLGLGEGLSDGRLAGQRRARRRTRPRAGPSLPCPLGDSRSGAQADMTTFSEWAREDTTELRTRIFDLPFNRDLAAGVLSQSRFQFYMIQDSLYLKEYSRALAMASAKAPDAAAMEQFARSAQGALIVERALHEGFFERFGIASEDAASHEPSPTCYGYTNFLLTVAHHASYEELVAAVLPCFWVYWDVGNHIAAEAAPDNPYQAWIDTYSDPSFGESVDAVIAICNLAAEQATEARRNAMLGAFKRSVQYEWMFWDSAYREERWPVEA